MFPPSANFSAGKAGWTLGLAVFRTALGWLRQGQLATGASQAAKGVQDFRSPKDRGAQK
jgi:hypothetical protein